MLKFNGDKLNSSKYQKTMTDLTDLFDEKKKKTSETQKTKYVKPAETVSKRLQHVQEQVDNAISSGQKRADEQFLKLMGKNITKNQTKLSDTPTFKYADDSSDNVSKYRDNVYKLYNVKTGKDTNLMSDQELHDKLSVTGVNNASKSVATRQKQATTNSDYNRNKDLNVDRDITKSLQDSFGTNVIDPLKYNVVRPVGQALGLDKLTEASEGSYKENQDKVYSDQAFQDILAMDKGEARDKAMQDYSAKFVNDHQDAFLNEYRDGQSAESVNATNDIKEQYDIINKTFAAYEKNDPSLIGGVVKDLSSVVENSINSPAYDAQVLAHDIFNGDSEMPDTKASLTLNSNNQQRSNTSKLVGEKTGAGQVGEFLYNTGLSMADSANQLIVETALGIPNLGLAMMGANSMADKMLETKSNGGTTSEMLQRGAISGGIEVATEMTPWKGLQELVGAKEATKLGKRILEQTFTEGAEEGIGYFMNYVADKAMAKNDSEQPQWSWEEFFSSIAGGSLSGGVMAAGAGTYGQVRYDQWTDSLRTNTEVQKDFKANGVDTSTMTNKEFQQFFNDHQMKLKEQMTAEGNEAEYESLTMPQLVEGVASTIDQSEKISAQIIYNDADLKDATDIKSTDPFVAQTAKNNAISNLQRTANRFNISDSTVKFFTKFINKNNINVVFDNTLGADQQGKEANGTIYINPESKDPFMTVLKHELTHYIANSTQYSDIAKVILKEEFGYKDGIPDVDDIDAIKTSYANHGINLDDNDAYHELVANAVQQTELFKDQASINKLVETNPSLSQKVFTMLNNIKNKLGNNSEYYKSLNSLTEKYIKAINDESNSKEEFIKHKDYISFDKNDLNSITYKKLTIARNNTDIINFFDNYIKTKMSGYKIYLAKIGKNIADNLKSYVNEDFEGYKVSIISHGGHSYKSHGNREYELRRGNTKEISGIDYSHLLDLIENFDAVIKFNVRPKYDELIMLSKYKNINYHIIFSINRKYKELNAKFIYTMNDTNYNKNVLEMKKNPDHDDSDIKSSVLDVLNDTFGDSNDIVKYNSLNVNNNSEDIKQKNTNDTSNSDNDNSMYSVSLTDEEKASLYNKTSEEVIDKAFKDNEKKNVSTYAQNLKESLIGDNKWRNYENIDASINKALIDISQTGKVSDETKTETYKGLVQNILTPAGTENDLSSYVRDYFHHDVFYVSKELLSYIKDRGYDKVFNKYMILSTKSGIDLGRAYNEMHDNYGSLFPDILNEEDQIDKLYSVLSSSNINTNLVSVDKTPEFDVYGGKEYFEDQINEQYDNLAREINSLQEATGKPIENLNDVKEAKKTVKEEAWKEYRNVQLLKGAEVAKLIDPSLYKERKSGTSSISSIKNRYSGEQTKIGDLESSKIFDEDILKGADSIETDGADKQMINELFIRGHNKASLNKTLYQNMNDMAGDNNDLRNLLDQSFEKPLREAKKALFENTEKNLTKIKKEVVERLGIKAGTKESAAVQWYGEGFKDDAERTPYGEQDLKLDFPDKYEAIKEANSIFREEYNDYLNRYNAMLSQIYKDPMAAAYKRFANLEAQASTYQQQIEDLKTKPQTAVRDQHMKYLETLLKASTTAWNNLRESIENGDYMRTKRLKARSDYYHHFQEMATTGIEDFKSILSNQGITNKLAGLTNQTNPKSRWMGFMQRQGHGDYTADAVGGFLKYSQLAEYGININPVVAKYTGILSDMREMSTEDDHGMNDVINWLQMYRNDLAGKTNPIDRGIANFGTKGRNIINLLNTINNRVKGNAIMGNLSSAISQFYNLPNALAMVQNPDAIYKGAKDYGAYIYGNQEMRDLMRQSVFLNERYMDSLYDHFGEITIGDRAKDVASFAMKFGDEVIARYTWFAAYNKAIKENIPEENRITYADNLTRDAIAGRGIGEVPIAQKSQLVKLIAPFNVEVNNQWNYMVKQLNTAIKSHGDEKKRALASLLIIMLSTWMMNEIRENWIDGRRTGFDLIDAFTDGIKDAMEETNPISMVTTVAQRLGGEVLNANPFGSVIAQALVPSDQDREKIFGQSDPTRYGTGNMGINAIIKPAIQYATDQNVDLQEVLMNILPSWGGRQLDRSLSYLQDVNLAPQLIINKKYGTKFKDMSVPGVYTTSGKLRYIPSNDIINFMVGLTQGSSATQAAKDYYESGKYFSDNKTDAYKDAVKAGGNAQQVYKAIQDASAVQTTHDSDGDLTSLSKDYLMRQSIDASIQDPEVRKALYDSLLSGEKIKEMTDEEFQAAIEKQYNKISAQKDLETTLTKENITEEQYENYGKEINSYSSLKKNGKSISLSQDLQQAQYINDLDVSDTVKQMLRDKYLGKTVKAMIAKEIEDKLNAMKAEQEE